MQPLLEHNEPVLIIGHSMDAIIAYDTLWEMSQQQVLSDKVAGLTLGNPLGMLIWLNPVVRRLITDWWSIPKLQLENVI